MHRSVTVMTVGAFILILAGSLPCHADAKLFSQAVAIEGIPAGGPYVPAGTLYDNEQSDGITSLASQNSSSTFTARTADDFTIVDAACATQQFAISRIRIQMVQADAAPQAFGVDLFSDNGSGTAPAAGITPFATLSQTSQMVFGPFGLGTSIFEASFDTPGLVLSGNTIYWISGFGTSAAANSTGFNNFFATSAGAMGTSPNGVIIAPDAGFPTWMPVQNVIGGGPLAYSFAIDGACIEDTGFDPAVPTLSPGGIALLAGLLALMSLAVMARRRRANG